MRKFIEIEKQDRIFTIIINRPEVRNAIDRPSANHLADVFRTFEADDDSEEAMAMGLANRVVEDGTSRAEAEKLAKQLSRFPQTCMRNDRLSAYEQFPMTIDDALVNEYHHGVASINSPELIDGLERFEKGKGRHGLFDDQG